MKNKEIIISIFIIITIAISIERNNDNITINDCIIKNL